MCKVIENVVTNRFTKVFFEVSPIYLFILRERIGFKRRKTYLQFFFELRQENKFLRNSILANFNILKIEI